MSRRTVTCARCNRTRSVHARGLCHPCHRHTQLAGSLTDYPTGRELKADRNARIIAAIRAGTSVSDVAEGLGLTYDTVRSIARAEGLVGNGNGGIPLSWLHPVPAAPIDPPCVGEVMDFDGLKGAELTPSRNPHVASGLALCAACPLTTRQWCLDVMQPRTLGSEWQGIAGGVVWSHGRVVYMPAESVEAAS